MERRFVSNRITGVSVEERDGDTPTITGHAAVFYDGTRNTEFEFFGMRERIMPEAFNNALSRPDDVRALFNHDSNHVLGRTKSGTVKLSVDDVGLRYDITPPDTQTGRDIVESIRRGDLSGSSFAFRVIGQRFSTEDSDDIREITDVELFDVGPVTFPAYESTDTGIRAIGDTSEAEQALAAHKAEIEADQRGHEMTAKAKDAAAKVAKTAVNLAG